MIKYAVAVVLLLCGIGLGLWLGQKYLPQHSAVPVGAERKPLYYRHPMNPQVISPTPAKDDMGMDYQPVYANEPAAAGEIRISPEKIQKLGVKTETLEMRHLTQNIRALGSIQADERRIRAVTPKFEGWIRRLYVNATGQPVQRGQPLMEIYSPELLTAQQEYFLARAGQQALREGSAQARETAAQLTANALRRLQYWDIAPAQLRRLQNADQPLDTLPLLSPAGGAVLEKPAVEGMRFMPGDLLFRIADLSRVWLLVDVFEQDLGLVRIGQTVQVHIDAYPERMFNGKIGFVYPTLATETRTVKVRIELPNPDGLLKVGLYGSATLAADQGDAVLAVSDAAVIDSGVRRVVLVQRGPGVFQPRSVTLGRQAGGYFEVLEGLQAGETVVVRANFLIDAESNLKAALGSFEAAGETPAAPSAAMPAHQHESH